MRNKGSISEYNKTKGGFGLIIDESNIEVNFEKIECNYDYIRIGDQVLYDLVKIYDGSYEALNIQFLKHEILSEIDKAYQKQSNLNGKVTFKTLNGFVIDYKGITIFLPNNEKEQNKLVQGEDLSFYVKSFCYHSSIIASKNEHTNIGLVAKFQKFIGKKEFFDFKVIVKNDAGIIVFAEENYGFIPNSHLGTLDKNRINIGDNITVSVIGCSIKGGLILSVRNHVLYNIIEELHNVYKNQLILSGVVKKVYSKYLILEYKGIELVLNKMFIPKNTKLEINQSIEFKIIDFNWSKTISISVLEATNHGILYQLKKDNLFRGTVNKITKNGLLININEVYIGFMHKKELTHNWNFDFNVLHENSLIKFSIKKFNSQGIYLSRIKYLKEHKRSIASSKFQLNDKVEVKIYEKMSPFGVLVSNEKINGIIPLVNILPELVIERINVIDFVKYCTVIFKRRTFISCVVSKIDKTNKKITFDLDMNNKENKEKVDFLIDYFLDKEGLAVLVKNFYKIKVPSNPLLSHP